ncbi:hypothetical protein LPB72_03995 [Hydrogenophaga crassostreae]|uniref:Regulatory protein FmdB Zinc ribbon domain-containing protein n=1 Tax=Hydrogenophaga crassostreae TaxID=1763535 RepID=A0A167IYJ4_9BURK|nr:DUF1178 family protein [Hydrogenophaga crassostreae]AOW14291.1 hypothetical protein LPB072_17040 [Hydrogenophaga crassostreae]OAD43814.1 hypothetical protein LPB72_03995 [Hydrogenophaga crassostreae]
MKVFDLQCAQQHAFEGWFGSDADYSAQQARGLVTCPLCGDATIQKMLSAPRLNLKSSRGTQQASSAEAETHPVIEGGAPAETAAQGGGQTVPSNMMQARLMRAMREVLAKTEDVGERFADQARAMHHGDIEQRSIRGQTTPDVAMELLEEGIDVMPLPQLHGLKETLQ